MTLNIVYLITITTQFCSKLKLSSQGNKVNTFDTLSKKNAIFKRGSLKKGIESGKSSSSSILSIYSKCRGESMLGAPHGCQSCASSLGMAGDPNPG